MRSTSLRLLLSLFLGLIVSCKKAPPPEVEAPAEKDWQSVSGLVQTAAVEIATNDATLSIPSEPAVPPPVPAPVSEPPSAPPAAAKAVLLKVKWPVGARYVYRMDLEQHSTNRIAGLPRSRQEDLALGMSYGISVVNSNAQGGNELEVEFLAYDLVIKIDGLLAMGFDSAGPRNAPADPITAPFKKVIGSKVRLQMDPEGRVDKVVGLSAWAAQVIGDEKGPAEELLLQQFNEGFFRQIADFGRGLPPRPVESGDNWPYKTEIPAGALGKIAMDSTVTLARWEDHEQHRYAVLESRGSVMGAPGGGASANPGALSIASGTVTGKSWFDPEPGLLIESAVEQSMQLRGEVPASPGASQTAAEFTSDIGQKVAVKLVETTHLR